MTQEPGLRSLKSKAYLSRLQTPDSRLPTVLSNAVRAAVDDDDDLSAVRRRARLVARVVGRDHVRATLLVRALLRLLRLFVRDGDLLRVRRRALVLLLFALGLRRLGRLVRDGFRGLRGRGGFIPSD